MCPKRGSRYIFGTASQTISKGPSVQIHILWRQVLWLQLDHDEYVVVLWITAQHIRMAMILTGGGGPVLRLLFVLVVRALCDRQISARGSRTTFFGHGLSVSLLHLLTVRCFCPRRRLLDIGLSLCVPLSMLEHIGRRSRVYAIYEMRAAVLATIWREGRPCPSNPRWKVFFTSTKTTTRPSSVSPPLWGGGECSGIHLIGLVMSVTADKVSV